MRPAYAYTLTMLANNQLSRISPSKQTDKRRARKEQVVDDGDERVQSAA